MLALTGDLGSGKTTFVQGLAEGLGIRQRIISPTFIIMRNYEIPQNKEHITKYKYFYHIDLYRLEKNIESELKNMGVDEIWSGPENAIAIEWAEKAKEFIPKSAKWIEFTSLYEDKRKIKLK